MVSELRSAAEALRNEALGELPDARIEQDFAELHRVMEVLEVERLRRLAELDRRRFHARDGHLSTASWLAARFRMAWGAARGDARVARALEHMPATRRALADGTVSLHAARVLVDARDVNHAAFERSEGLLVEAATRHPIAELRRVAATWRERVDRDRFLEGDEGLPAGRRLHASVSFGGMVRVDGDLDPECGETLLTALAAVPDVEARSRGDDDVRTPAQRRVDALGEICRQWLDGGRRPKVAGERPHVTVTMDADALRHVASSDAEVPSSELDHVGPVSTEVAARLACDASLTRVVLAGRSEPLDVGRRTPLVPPAMRRVVIVRDRGCRFPGCDRPHAWCDAHHVVHWARGGPTAVANLVLLCRRHHRIVHARGGFGLELIDGRPVFRRPDGSVLETSDGRAPP